MLKKMLVALIGVGLSAVAYADQGDTGAAFLKLDTGPRAIAMGGSFAGLADDVNAIQYDPAGLAYLQDKEVTLMHAVWFEDIFYDYLAVAYPLGGNLGTIGVSGLYVDDGIFQETTLDSAGNPVVGGTFTGDSIEGALTYSRVIIPSVSIGVNLKYISESIAGSSSSSEAVDIGGTWHSPIPNLNAGFDIQNLGPSIGFSQTYTLPVNFRLGVGYKPTDYISVDCDYDQPIETVGFLSLGGEYGYRDFLYLRMGYSFQGAVDYNQTFTDFGPAIASGLAMGIGFKFYKNYSADYSYSNYGFLGTPSRISLTAKFQ
jgi:hypothetical protein